MLLAPGSRLARIVQADINLRTRSSVAALEPALAAILVFWRSPRSCPRSSANLTWSSRRRRIHGMRGVRGSFTRSTNVGLNHGSRSKMWLRALLKVNGSQQRWRAADIFFIATVLPVISVDFTTRLWRPVELTMKNTAIGVLIGVLPKAAEFKKEK